MTEPAEILTARRVIERNACVHPIDVFSLLDKYAKYDLTDDMGDMDGICFNPKGPGRPIVLLNSNKPIQRKTFTAAHELGHILIPWHIGNIIDVSIEHIDVSLPSSDKLRELEANRFASELLMPVRWVNELLVTYQDPIKVSKFLDEHNISMLASTIKLGECLPAGYCYAHLINDKVKSSGRTPGTVAKPISEGETLRIEHAYDYVKNIYCETRQREKYIWWNFDEINCPVRPNGIDWRNIIREIIVETVANDRVEFAYNSIIGTLQSDFPPHRQASLNGIYNSYLHKKKKIGSHSEYGRVVLHPRFDDFLCARAHSYFK